MEKAKLVQILRECSHVKRVHTVPWHGDYFNGQHTYDMLALLLVLHPNPSMNLLQAVMWHDVAERYLGDMPAPTKWANEGKLGEEMKEIEERLLKKLGLLVELTEDEKCWLAAVDRIELWLAAKDQVQLGNQNAMSVARNLGEWFKKAKLPMECRKFLDDHKWTRNDDYEFVK